MHNMSQRLFLIDGHALVFKMYYAFLRRPMINTKGEDMSILFGFTKYLLELMDSEKPDYLAVAFDPSGGTFRNDLFPQYKGNRPPTPQLVIDALEPLCNLCKVMNIPVLMEPGFEADDVIGSMAKRCASDTLDVYMVTPDKDYGQLVDKHIFQYKPGKSGSENEILGVHEICEKYGIDSPLQVVDMLTICGDTADNVPGVKGIGEVGAGKLISKYGSVKAIYEHIRELSERQRQQFEDARGHIELSHTLVTIKTDMELSTDLVQMKLDLNFQPEITTLFKQYEFNSLQRYIKNVPSGVDCIKQSSKIPETVHCQPADLIRELNSGGTFAFAVRLEGTGISAKADSVAAAVLTTRGTVLHTSASPSSMAAILSDPTIDKFCYGAKAQLNALANSSVELAGPLKDVELMHYLLNPERSHDLELLASSILGFGISEQKKQGEYVSDLFSDAPQDSVAEEDLSLELAAILLLGRDLSDQLRDNGLDRLYNDMEEPLISVLARMERNGIRVDMASLSEFASQLREEISLHESTVREISGEPGLNLSSPKQLGELLFEKLAIDPKAKKSSKGSWSTDEETLLALSDRTPIIDEVLQYRAAKKLLSTYIEPFPGYISPLDGRVHTTFNQALTATGRLSSSNPNLQNIPIRTQRGQEIRKAFIGRSVDSLVMSADYSQIELRIMAHLCGDNHLQSAFVNGEDVHKATASKIFGIGLEDVTSEQRRVAKMANFGIMYGISSFGLAQRLGCSRSEAKKIIDDYFTSFPSIRQFIDDTVARAREIGYVETLFGRRRYLPDINARNATVRALAERNAVNAPIQGTSADIIKLAMSAIDRKMRSAGMESMMVLQIHDELLFDVVPSELDELRTMVVGEMENVIELSIPLTVECNYGQNWLQSH